MYLPAQFIYIAINYTERMCQSIVVLEYIETD